MPILTITRGSKCTKYEFTCPAKLSEILQKAGFTIEHPCGGRGLCGKCAVEVEGCISEMSPAESKMGMRLACQTTLLGDACVTLSADMPLWQIETAGIEPVTLGHAMPGEYGAAVDIGTTTIALKLYQLKTGTCLGSVAMRNPQTSVAADVMGRIDAALKGQLSTMSNRVRSAISELLKRTCAESDVEPQRVESMVIAGNTTMLYLLTNRSPHTLARAPFQADCLFGDMIHTDKYVYITPCMNAFVGGDITCAVLAAKQCENNAISLLMDIGTNGELALWKNGCLYVTSTAAGPAFEGVGITYGCGSVDGAIDRVTIQNGTVKAHTIGEKHALGICGSGVLDAIACALKMGIIDETGAMDEDALILRDGIYLTASDIRSIQLAKAAIAAGLQTLMEEANVADNEIETVYIAGGFGSHLNVESAAGIGLIPDTLAEKVQVIGNAALSGAARILLNADDVQTATQIVKSSHHINLGGNTRFNEHYIEQMLFPECL